MMTRLIPRRSRRSALPVLRDVRGFDHLFDDLWRGFCLAFIRQLEKNGFTSIFIVEKHEEYEDFLTYLAETVFLPPATAIALDMK